MNKTEQIIKTYEDEHLKYLENLRESGITNMYGAAPYLKEKFRLDINQARKILSYWMNNYTDLCVKFGWRK